MLLYAYVSRGAHTIIILLCTDISLILVPNVLNGCASSQELFLNLTFFLIRSGGSNNNVCVFVCVIVLVVVSALTVAICIKNK